MVNQLIELFGKIILMMGLGFTLERVGTITEEMKKNLSKLLMEAVLPASILASAFQPFEKENFLGIAIVFGVSALYYLISLGILILISKKIKGDWGFKSVFINLIVFANVGFIGFPLLVELFGQKGLLYGVAYNVSYQIFFFSLGIYLMELGDKTKRKKVIFNKIILISLLSVFLYILPFRLPNFVGESLSMVGSMIVPLSMIIIGCEVSRMDFRSIFTEKYPYIISFFRLILLPFVMCLVLSVFKIERDIALIIVLLTALPSGSLTVIFSEEKNCDTQLAVRGVAQTTLLMLISVPIVLIIMKNVFV
ncbi:AEC family transporter [uncultured Ilyobacter sp.]|uniref:AEC family transporter n=1 Tax=uncultured Ilyobacter sp. TaxID=544433 RepID=UPI0029F59065|nr:AEC family transporter [uncultured Ilyobacter sp.]